MTAGDLERACAAADELSRVAALFQSKALVASAALAHGRVGWPKVTRRVHSDFEEAAHLWNEIGAPDETTLARMGLGHAHRAVKRGARVMRFERPA